MRVRLPLYAKISLWFFLNLIALAAVFLLLFNAQFNFKLDWLMATGARERLQAVRDLIVGELDASLPDQWPQVLQRYSEAHGVDFALFDENGGPLVGAIATLPAAVRERITSALDTPSPGDGRASHPQRRPWPPAPLRVIMRTSEPKRYWLLSSALLDNPQTGGPLRAVLVARSTSMSAGGLVFDPKPWVALALGAVVFSLLFWLPLVRGISRSLARMTQATRQIADGRFDVRVNTRRGDELGALSEAIDQMAERLDGFVKGQKRFLGDVAHELCAPLAKLQMALGILEERPGDSQYVQSAADKAGQIAALVGELLSFSKASFGTAAVELKPVQVAPALQEALRREWADNAEIRVELAADLVVRADNDLLIRALSNLLRNAIRHAAHGGPISIHAGRHAGQVRITISDCGPGVAEEELPRIFDAFYRVDASRTRDTGGTGLGLTIVKACIDSCCGSVSAHNLQPSGLEVILDLPAA